MAISCLIVKCVVEMRSQCMSTGDFVLVCARVVLCGPLAKNLCNFT